MNLKPRPTQQFLMDLIKKFQKEFKRDPDTKSLAKALGCSESSIFGRLQILRKNKFIGKDVCIKEPDQHLRQKWLKKHNLK